MANATTGPAPALPVPSLRKLSCPAWKEHTASKGVNVPLTSVMLPLLGSALGHSSSAGGKSVPPALAPKPLAPGVSV